MCKAKFSIIKTFKRISVIFLITAICIQANHAIFSIVLYNINKAQVIDNLCQKTRPGCDGKCWLNKQIEDQERENLPVENPVKQSKTSSLQILNEYVTNSLYDLSLIKDQSLIFFSNDFTIPLKNKTTDIFHPPKHLS